MEAKKCVGITVNGDKLNLVSVQFSHRNSPPAVLDDLTLKLQAGNRPQSYNAMYERVRNYLRENDIECVAIKESAASKNSGLSHLLAAELRGVVIAACQSTVLDVLTVKKATISRTFGQRKVDDYVADDSFWESNLVGELRKGSREAALVVIAAKG
ncbi:MAG: hypothetical protein O2890_10620 [Cyanobacteria bacterium]|nr:hypothetical protein [Cyanobacteriota bacterium]MDA0866853.1 hypothetical protein [Cyanobacteriota bacterium]